jgi:signal transduction histidine kinase
MARAFARLGRTVGTICLTGTALDVIAHQFENPACNLLPALLPVAMTMLVLFWSARHPSAVASLSALLVSGICLFLFATILLNQSPAVLPETDVAFAYFAVAVIFMDGFSDSAISGVLWCTGAYVVTQFGLGFATVLAGMEPQLNVLATIVEVGLVAILVMLGSSNVRRERFRPIFDRAVFDEANARAKQAAETRIAALIHDTVLDDLTAIADAEIGPLSATLAKDVDRDLAVLRDENWHASRASSGSCVDWSRSQIRASILQAARLPLQVDVVGDIAELGRLTHERDTATGLAVKQCLVNVHNHAETDSAEVMIIGSEADVSVLVVDSGVGFAGSPVEKDRLGIRQSVRRRIETVGGEVTVWSHLGRGTCVLIRVPAVSRVGASNDE